MDGCDSLHRGILSCSLIGCCENAVGNRVNIHVVHDKAVMVSYDVRSRVGWRVVLVGHDVVPTIDCHASVIVEHAVHLGVGRSWDVRRDSTVLSAVLESEVTVDGDRVVGVDPITVEVKDQIASDCLSPCESDVRRQHVASAVLEGGLDVGCGRCIDLVDPPPCLQYGDDAHHRHRDGQSRHDSFAFHFPSPLMMSALRTCRGP